FERPATRFVATFVGRASVLSAVLEGEGTVRVDQVRWPAELSPDLAGTNPGETVDLVVRPESLTFASAGDSRALAGRVTERRYAGPVTYYQVTLAAGGEVEVLADSDAAMVGGEVWVVPNEEGPKPRVFPGSAGVSPAQVNEQARPTRTPALPGFTQP
ncbi:MAG TPA: TOBE domain-containing protein, partial [Thermoanaerobaculia bacterium]